MATKCSKMVSDVCPGASWGRLGGYPGSSEAPGWILESFPDESGTPKMVPFGRKNVFSTFQKERLYRDAYQNVNVATPRRHGASKVAQWAPNGRYFGTFWESFSGSSNIMKIELSPERELNLEGSRGTPFLRFFEVFSKPCPKPSPRALLERPLATFADF